jgi:hypothetical protein
MAIDLGINILLVISHRYSAGFTTIETEQHLKHTCCCIQAIGWESMDWIHFTQDRDHWQVLVSGAMNLQGP